MVKDISIRFLGTSSQTGPSRNYSSLLISMDHQTVMVDCGESTQRQLLSRNIGGDAKMHSIRHIFITHLHQDHVLGLVPLLCSMMGPNGSAPTSNGAGASSAPSSSSNAEKRPRVEIFGPSGLRALIRTTLTLCYATLSGYYTVHELLWPNQSAYLNDSIVSSDAGVVSASFPEAQEELLGATNGPQRYIPHLPPLECELPGMDFRMDVESATWPSIATVNGVMVSAAPVLHRCPTLGYVFEEPASSSKGVTADMIQKLDRNAEALLQTSGIKQPRSLLKRLARDRVPVQLPDGSILEPPLLDIAGRRVVILGDTYDATAGLDSATASESVRGMAALAQDADCLVHECTSTALPAELLTEKKGQRAEAERRDEVRAKALMRGHSTPQVAGAFAARCRARQLILNHFSIKYPAPHPLFSMDESTTPQSKQQSNGAARGRRDKDRMNYLTMREIERQATEAWHAGEPELQGPPETHAIASFDGMVYHVQPKVSSLIDGRDDEAAVDNANLSPSHVPASAPFDSTAFDVSVDSTHSFRSEGTRPQKKSTPRKHPPRQGNTNGHPSQRGDGGRARPE